MLIEDFDYYKKHKNLVTNEYGMDTANACMFGKEWWLKYPNQNILYQFNSQGFRDKEFKVDEKVNLCIGDSAVTNIGGPQNQSWPVHLESLSGKRCVNLGLVGAGNDAIVLLAERAVKYFNVDKIFVMFSFLNRYMRLSEKTGRYKFCSDSVDHQANVEYFITNFNKLQKIDVDFYFTFIRNTSYSPDESAFLNEYKTKTNYVSYTEFPNQPLYSEHQQRVDQNRKYYTDKEKYNIFRSHEWPTYNQWIKGAKPHPDMYTIQFGNILNPFSFSEQLPRYFNRDGWHFADYANLNIAKNFFTKIA